MSLQILLKEIAELRRKRQEQCEDIDAQIAELARKAQVKLMEGMDKKKNI